MKLDRRYLMKVIIEAMDESVFDKLMRLITTDYQHAQQAMDLYDMVSYELSPEEQAEIQQAYIKAIVKESDNPGRDLKEIDFDFHQLFVDIYGIAPPMAKEFTLWDSMEDKPVTLRTTVYGEAPDVPRRVGHDVEFELFFDYNLKRDKSIIEPWIRFETMHGKDGWVSWDGYDIGVDEDENYSAKVDKEKLPGVIRQAMGIPWDADISGWPELPKGSPPAEGSDIEPPVDLPYEGKRKLDKSFLFEVINEVLREDEDEGFSAEEAKRVEEMISSNNPREFIQGVELMSMGFPGATDIIDSYTLELPWAAGVSNVFLAVEDEREAEILTNVLKRIRKKQRVASKVYFLPASIRHLTGNWMMDDKGFVEFIEGLNQDHDGYGRFKGNYILKITLDAPVQEEILQESLIYEDEGEEDDNYAMISAKVKKFIDSEDFGFYMQGFDLVDVYDMSDLITQEEANGLKEKIWVAAFRNDLAHENIDELKDMIDEFRGLSEDDRLEFEWSIYFHLASKDSLKQAVKYAVREFDVMVVTINNRTLLELEGEPKELEKAKKRLMRFGQEENLFAMDVETGNMFFGSLAEKYVSFGKKMEEIFGATPGGDVDIGGDLALYLRMDYPGTVKAPLANNNEVTASITFEWSVELGYGMEITLVPTKLATQPSQLLNDYYGIWVDQWKEGPNIGKLEIGIQSTEDDFEDNKSVQNDSGGYGLTKEEMKKKILELTGIDLDEIK